MKSGLYWLCFVCCAVAAVSDAARFKLRGPTSNDSLQRRTSVDVLDSQDTEYKIEITLGGNEYIVMIDTGSADLWVADTSVPNSQDTGKEAEVSYDTGGAKGPILTADLQFAGYTISEQDFFLAEPSSNNPAKAGVIGLGPRNNSNIWQARKVDGNSTDGEPPMDRIFRGTEDPYFTIFLGRISDSNNDAANQFAGELTIGEVLPDWSNVTNQTRLPAVTVPSKDSSGQHWAIHMYGVLVNGEVVPLQSNVTSATSPQLVAVLDTGYSFPQVPRELSDAIYKDAGGNFTTVEGFDGEYWVFPCDKELNVTFLFGGDLSSNASVGASNFPANMSYPIHPLDLIYPTSDGRCIGTLQPRTKDLEGDITFDLILGMAFLRNVYVLINGGDMYGPSWVGNNTDPYIQLLSLTNPTRAHEEFLDALQDFATDISNTNSTSNAAGDLTKVNGRVQLNTLDKVAIAFGGFFAVSCILAVCYVWWKKHTERGENYAPLSAPAPGHEAPKYTAHPVEEYEKY